MWIEFLLNGLAAFVFGLVFFGVAYFLAYRAGVFDDELESESSPSDRRRS